MIDPDSTDWSSVYVSAQSYNPSVIPLPIRMGRPRYNKIGDIPPNEKGNIELLKVIISVIIIIILYSVYLHEVVKYQCCFWKDFCLKSISNLSNTQRTCGSERSSHRQLHFFVRFQQFSLINYNFHWRPNRRHVFLDPYLNKLILIRRNKFTNLHGIWLPQGVLRNFRERGFEIISKLQGELPKS